LISVNAGEILKHIFFRNVVFPVYAKEKSEQFLVATVYALFKCRSECPGCRVVKEDGFFNGGEK
jgi:hypothetical protein